MILLGLDAASDLRKFGVVMCRWTHGKLSLLAHGTLDQTSIRDAITQQLRTADRALLAIDAPLGWPAALGQSLAGHQAGQAIAVAQNTLFRRATDVSVHQRTGKLPLEVGADRIARAAWQALNVLQQLRAATGPDIPLAWAPDFADRIAAIEVYPGALLKATGGNPSGYKEQVGGVAARALIATRFAELAPWLGNLVDQRADVFDAALCTLAGIDFLRGVAIPPDDLALARKEGWAWVRPLTPHT